MAKGKRGEPPAGGAEPPESGDMAGIVNIQEYVWALQILDSEDGLGDIIGEIQNANAGSVAGALSQLGGVLGRLRDIINLRGWKPQAGAIQMAFRANLADWQPKGTLLRINLDVTNPEPESLPTLWDARGKLHDVIIRGGVRQPALGEKPPEWDLAGILEAHEHGDHKIVANIGCPNCLAELEAKRRAMPAPLEGAEPEPEPTPGMEPAEPYPEDEPDPE